MFVHPGFGVNDFARSTALYDQALAAGGRDKGVPGLRPDYHSDYPGAFVPDPDGFNLEAVCHTPV